MPSQPLASPRAPVRRFVCVCALAALMLVAAACDGSIVVVPRTTAEPATALPPNTAPPAGVMDMLVRNIEASNAEDVDAYMATIHPDSPAYAQTETTMRELVSMWDLAYTFGEIGLMSETEDEARISGVLTTRKLAGPAFADNRIDMIMVFRRHQGEWRIFGQEIVKITYEE